jgi:hypothetical protein
VQIYVARGLEEGLAREVAKQLLAKDALGAHARDELGISAITTARPVQAALASLPPRFRSAPRRHSCWSWSRQRIHSFPLSQQDHCSSLRFLAPLVRRREARAC